MNLEIGDNLRLLTSYSLALFSLWLLAVSFQRIIAPLGEVILAGDPPLKVGTCP